MPPSRETKSPTNNTNYCWAKDVVRIILRNDFPAVWKTKDWATNVCLQRCRVVFCCACQPNTAVYLFTYPVVYCFVDWTLYISTYDGRSRRPEMSSNRVSLYNLTYLRLNPVNSHLFSLGFLSKTQRSITLLKRTIKNKCVHQIFST